MFSLRFGETGFTYRSLLTGVSSVNYDDIAELSVRRLPRYGQPLEAIIKLKDGSELSMNVNPFPPQALETLRTKVRQMPDTPLERTREK